MIIIQRRKILKYLQQRRSITSWEAYKYLGITQFATRVKELKQEGYLFKTEWESKENKDGQMVKFKRYYLMN